MTSSVFLLKKKKRIFITWHYENVKNITYTLCQCLAYNVFFYIFFPIKMIKSLNIIVPSMSCTLNWFQFLAFHFLCFANKTNFYTSAPDTMARIELNCKGYHRYKCTFQAYFRLIWIAVSIEIEHQITLG